MLRNIIGWFLLALLVSSCATDQGLENTNNAESNCDNACTAGESRCDGDVVQACTSDAQGCLDWTTGVDCAESELECDDNAEPAICLSEPGTCDDTEQNQDESDADCGGLRCEPCELGKTCEDASDCESNNCDAGVTDECVTPDTPTCTDGKQNQDETDVDCGGAVCEGCSEGEVCTQAADCESGNCTAGTCRPGQGGCNDGDTQCVGNTVQSCQNNQWVESQICAQMCEQGACSDTVTCNPSENRCFKNSVQQCNATGTAWQHLTICNEDCDQGLCVGSCQPGEFRCNVDKREVCAPDGMSWDEVEACTNGCAQQTCIEQGLVNQGVPQSLSGVHVYQDCVKVELGGEITVPADETLEIFAKCLEVTSSSSITLESNARFIFHATDTITNDGSISGGAYIQLSAYTTFDNGGSITSNTVKLRGDRLTNKATGSIGGNVTYALYGSDWTNDGTHTGEVSVMPPVEVSSPTHPEGFWWNLNEDDVSVSWNKPFASVRGYYVSLNGAGAPDPSNSDFSTQENLTIPLGRFRKGANLIKVVAVNADSTIGTVVESFPINFNVSTPQISSTSHADSTVWTNVDDVFLEWDESTLDDADSFVGYWHAWDHNGDTHPTAANGTFRNDNKLLLNDQAPGVWAFHLSLIDRFGRTAPFPAHYQVRVGNDPGAGNVAGNITDAGDQPILGARVRVNGGLYSTASVSSGDYTFNGLIPSAAFDYEVEVTAPGFVPQTQTVRMNAAQVEILNFKLQPDNAPANYRLGFETTPQTGTTSYPVPVNVSVGQGNDFMYSFGSRVGVAGVDGSLKSSRSVNPRSGSTGIAVGFTGSRYFSAYAYSSYYSYVTSFEPKERSFSYQTAGSHRAYGSTMAWSGSDFGLVSQYGGAIQFAVVDEELDDISNTPGEYLDLNNVSTDSNSSIDMLWDGNAYAIAFVGYEDDYALYFMKVGKDGSVIQTPVKVIDLFTNSAVGIAFDGSSYYVSGVQYDSQAATRYALKIASINAQGVPSQPVEIGRTLSASYQERHLDLAFDGRNLLAAYVIDSRGKVATIDRSSLRPMTTFELGEARNIGIDFGFHARRGAVVYQNASRRDINHRAILID